MRTKSVRCAIYTRVSTDQGLEQDFNSLDAQYDASQAYIRSQAHAGWTLLRARYDDGGFSGGNTERPALQRLLEDVRARKVDVIVVYKVDRLMRSLADFAKLVKLFDEWPKLSPFRDKIVERINDQHCRQISLKGHIGHTCFSSAPSGPRFRGWRCRLLVCPGVLRPPLPCSIQ